MKTLTGIDSHPLCYTYMHAGYTEYAHIVWIAIPYAYGTYHTHIMHTCIWHVPYAYGTKYAYGTE